MNRIVVTFLVSYDAEYLKHSIPLVYDHVDTVVLAVDRNRLTWKGNKYELPADFFEWGKAMDRDHKVSIYEDTFYVAGKGPLELDCRQRQMAAEHAGMDNTWHVQVDADEYVVNFADLVAFLRQEEQRGTDSKEVLYFGKLVPLFKQDGEGYFFVDNGEDFEKVALAAVNPTYIAARKTVANRNVIMDVYVVHQTFAREYSALKWKISNWGHSNDFDTESYLKLWSAIDRHNCRYLSNFHPTYAPAWKKLQYMQASDIPHFIQQYMSMLELRKAAGGGRKPIYRRILAKGLRILNAAKVWIRGDPRTGG